MVNLFGDENYPKQDIRTFLARAKNNTYVVGENEVLSSKPDSHDFRYEEGDYLYMDSYLGNQKFIGEECIWIKNNPVWAMNYQYLCHSEDRNFIKRVIIYISVRYKVILSALLERKKYITNRKRHIFVLFMEG